MNGCQESLMFDAAPIVNPITLTVKKRCSKCGEIKVLKEFGSRAGRLYGKRSDCKFCVNLEGMLYRKTYPEKVKERNKRFRILHPGIANAATKKWGNEYPDRKKAATKKWREAHPEKVREMRRKAMAKDRNTLKGKLNYRFARAINKHLKRGVKARRHWECLVGYTTDQLKEHIEKLFTKGMTWEIFKDGGIHIDHKVPIAAFNFEKPEDLDFQMCWGLNNLQPMWAKENIQKGAKINRPFQPSLTIERGE